MARRRHEGFGLARTGSREKTDGRSHSRAAGASCPAHRTEGNAIAPASTMACSRRVRARSNRGYRPGRGRRGDSTKRVVRVTHPGCAPLARATRVHRSRRARSTMLRAARRELQPRYRVPDTPGVEPHPPHSQREASGRPARKAERRARIAGRTARRPELSNPERRAMQAERRAPGSAVRVQPRRAPSR